MRKQQFLHLDSIVQTCIHIEPLVTHIDRNNAPNLISGFDVVASCLDNLETRYILNEACVRAGIPMVEAGIMGFTGMVTVIKAGQGPCYNCLFPQDRSIRNSSMMKHRDLPARRLGSTAGMAGSVRQRSLNSLGWSFSGRCYSLTTFGGFSIGFDGEIGEMSGLRAYSEHD